MKENLAEQFNQGLFWSYLAPPCTLPGKHNSVNTPQMLDFVAAEKQVKKGWRWPSESKTGFWEVESQMTVGELDAGDSQLCLAQGQCLGKPFPPAAL